MIKTLGVLDAFSWNQDESPIPPERWAQSRILRQPLAAWVLGRMIQAQRLDSVVVVVREGQSQGLRPVVPAYAPICESKARDWPEMLVDVTKWYPAVAVIRVGIDDPLIDAALIDHLIGVASKRPDCDYLGFQTDSGIPISELEVGMFPEWYRVSSLLAGLTPIGSRRVDRRGRLYRRDTAHVPFQFSLIDVPQSSELETIRLRLRSFEDLDCVEDIIDALGRDCLDWMHVARLIRSNPELQSRTQVESCREASDVAAALPRK